MKVKRTFNQNAEWKENRSYIIATEIEHMQSIQPIRQQWRFRFLFSLFFRAVDNVPCSFAQSIRLLFTLFLAAALICCIFFSSSLVKIQSLAHSLNEAHWKCGNIQNLLWEHSKFCGITFLLLCLSNSKCVKKCINTNILLCWFVNTFSDLRSVPNHM